jgi:ABC-type branched-subunit amino acid transport system substrate-binding protein
VSYTTYDARQPDWPRVLAEIAAAKPDVLILASYIPDGVAFRRAMLAAHLHVGALIGSTMAECGPDFGLELGSAAIGVFASDRPTQGFNPDVLTPEARATYERFSRAWQQTTGTTPTEEGLAGFTAAWALFHDVLPRAAALDAASIAAAARTLDIPRGGLPNGAGVRFSSDLAMLGQNTRAAAVIWQWQAVRHSVTVWPPVDATGTAQLIPLPA